MPERILVVDDEKLIRWSLKERLASGGYEVLEAANAAEAQRLLSEQPFDLALVDFKLPDGDGIGLLRTAQRLQPDLPVLIITAYSTVNSAVEAMKEGAFDYISKPFNMEELVITVARALDMHSMRRTLDTEVSRRKKRFGINNLIGKSPAMRRIKELVLKVASSETTTVLLLGETGTGKDMVARAIHYESSRIEKPFMNITCTALPETLLESELFGFEEGAFTNAKGRKKGLFELGHNGTVFMDEIGDMPLQLQGKLLRVLEEKAFKRIGGAADITVDARIVAATNRDLLKLIDEGKFREDLYYRLNTVPIELPSLRERTEDIPLLAEHFREQFAEKFKRNLKPLDQAVLGKLTAYRWPGNVREMRNVIERAALLAPGDRIAEEDVVLGRADGPRGAGLVTLPPKGCNLSDVEKTLLEQALQRTKGNQTRAAELLGITRDQIRYKMEKFEIAIERG